MNSLYGLALGAWNALRGYTGQLNELEWAILRQTTSMWIPEMRAKFDLRCRRLSRIYRLDGGREVIAYEIRKGNNVFPEETAVITKPGVCKIADFMLRSGDSLSSLSGTVLVNHGNFGLIKFSASSEHATLLNVAAIEIVLNDDEEEVRRLYASL